MLCLVYIAIVLAAHLECMHTDRYAGGHRECQKYHASQDSGE
jgi:protein gp37